MPKLDIAPSEREQKIEEPSLGLNGHDKLSLGVNGADNSSVNPIEEKPHEDFVQMYRYIVGAIPKSHHAAFTEQLLHAAMEALNANHLDDLRALMLNWEATAEIHAIPGEAERIVNAIELSESTRHERRQEGVWNWRDELAYLTK